MNPALAFLKSLARIVFLRGSPERILYDRRLFWLGLTLALVFSALAEATFHQQHLVFVILRVFAETTLFMLWMVLLTAKVARMRLASLMLVLVWINGLGDVLLVLLSPLGLDPAVRMTVSAVLGGILIYGAANAVAWALRGRLSRGVLHAGLYAGAVWALVLSFQALYNIIAGSGG